LRFTLTPEDNPASEPNVDYERFFVDCLPTVKQVVQAVARRHYMTESDAEELSSVIKLKMVENDYALLRSFQRRSSVRTYLTVIARRELLDRRNAEWGKWRPCLNARRAGATGVLLDQMLTRDGYSFDEACELLHSKHGVTLTRDKLYALSLELTPRTNRRFVGEEPLAVIPAVDPQPDKTFEAKSSFEHAIVVEEALRAALEQLTPQDRLILKMNFCDDLPLSQIARVLQLEPKPLYRRVGLVLTLLRTEVERRGVSREQALALIGHPDFDFSSAISEADEGNSARRPSSQ
jgi:RNA polymerase sigma factor for flagellar operon FliA